MIRCDKQNKEMSSGNKVRECEWDSAGLGQGPVASNSEQGKNPGLHKSGEFIVLINYLLLNYDFFSLANSLGS